MVPWWFYRPQTMIRSSLFNGEDVNGCTIQDYKDNAAYGESTYAFKQDIGEDVFSLKGESQKGHGVESENAVYMHSLKELQKIHLIDMHESFTGETVTEFEGQSLNFETALERQRKEDADRRRAESLQRDSEAQQLRDEQQIKEEFERARLYRESHPPEAHETATSAQDREELRSRKRSHSESEVKQEPIEAVKQEDDSSRVRADTLDSVQTLGDSPQVFVAEHAHQIVDDIPPEQLPSPAGSPAASEEDKKAPNPDREQDI